MLIVKTKKKKRLVVKCSLCNFQHFVKKLIAIVNVEILLKKKSQLRYQYCSKLQPNFL